MRVRRRHRLRRALAWGLVAAVSSLAGGLAFAYYYITDSDNLAAAVTAVLPKYLPGARIDLGRARVRPFGGEFHLTHLRVQQVIDGAPFLTVRIPWLGVRADPREVLRGRLDPSEVAVVQPTLRLRRRADGTWNLQGLLASPWPGPVMKTPPIKILNGTVELSDGPSPDVARAVLRDVNIGVESAGPGKLAFEGSAKGDSFDRLVLRGTVEVKTGRVTLSGDVTRLSVPDPGQSRLPAEWKPALRDLGLSGGEVDLTIARIAYDPAKPAPLSYDVSGRLRGGVWNCPRLPFPLNDLSARFAARDGTFTVTRAEGFYGTTAVRVARASVSLADPAAGPLGLEMSVVDLKLDEHLRAKSPPELGVVWREFEPSGRVDLTARAGRDRPGGPVHARVEVLCRDVAMNYKYFRYPVDHVRGRIVWDTAADRVTVEGMQTVIGGGPLTASGTIDHPGPDAVVKLDFAGGPLPVDQTLFKALPPEVRAVVNDFRPTGTVRGTARVVRTPPKTAQDDPRGDVLIDAYLDLDERCGIVWKGLPYPINNLTGRFEIHPDLWVFKNMRGFNGLAEITGSGQVRKVGGTPQKPDLTVDLRLKAERLPFDDQLRNALPPAWQKSWAILSPTGSSSVDAAITVRPGRPDHYLLEIAPGPATGVTLTYTRDPVPGVDRGGTFALPMEHVTGRFVFNNGPVDMHDVGFRFYGAPVRFARGRVLVEDSGEFQLGVEDVRVKDIRLDSRLRAIMPPVMAQFARRLDDGRTFALRGDLGLGWPGRPGAPVWCRWDKALVVFDDNSVQIQPGLSLEHLQGQLDHVRGRTDGNTFDLDGALSLASVSLLGQQITRLESPIAVHGGSASLTSLRGTLLGGEVTGGVGVTLDATPRYAARLAVRGADLQQYARTLPGRQTFRGLVDARLELSGLGGDLHTLRGSGDARIADGALGELPFALQLLSALKLSPDTKTAFDSADVALTIANGTTSLDPIRFTGNAFTLHGRGTMGVQGDLDLRLKVLYGRDRIHVRGLSDLVREASGQLLVVAVRGTPAFPSFKLLPLPEASDALKSFGQRQRAHREAERRR